MPILIVAAPVADMQVQAEASWPSVFVRLSIRSPKDAALSSASFDGHFAASLEAYKPLPDASQAAASAESSPASGDTQLTTDADQNLRLHALYAASMRTLRCDSARAVIATLVRSPRIQRDLADFCAGACATMNVVIREYVEFEPELEFRAFVCDGRVTALTQYCEFIYFPRLHARRAEVERVLCAFCDERVLPAMRAHQPELRSFVVDVILISSMSRAGVASDPYERLEGWVCNSQWQCVVPILFSMLKSSQFVFRILICQSALPNRRSRLIHLQNSLAAVYLISSPIGTCLMARRPLNSAFALRCRTSARLPASARTGSVSCSARRALSECAQTAIPCQLQASDHDVRSSNYMRVRMRTDRN